MKKFKFRAWYEPNKVMQFFFLGEVPVSDQIMQFTGFKDQNGKDIYEGDIVNHWKETFEIKDLLQFGYWVFECTFDNECAEVIGNIYENPELLVKG